MTTPTVHTVFIQVEAPKGDYQGKLAEGCYIVESDLVTLTNRRGVPVQDDEGKRYEQKLEGNNPKWVAGQLTKQFRKALRGNNAPPRGFSGPINYPKSWKSVACCGGMAFAVLKPSQAARRGERYAVSARSDKAGTVSCSSAVLASARSPTRAVAGFRCGCTTLPCGSPYSTPPRSRRRRRQYPQRCHVGFTWETTMKDVRGQQKAEREFLDRPRVKCALCGRHYLTADKRGWFCSRKCRERFEEISNEN